ncbi:vWA domain-containing protein [Luteimonas lutimaris]|uniref:VWA domain-containing protein n=1 Tax=Luteimonas lutimaris TaxID=698645 RepID=A0ABP7MC80_9GAMM|nr:VWA domain-containing protein [Luteimonas sp.]
MTQPVIPDVALVDNTEQRTPLVLVLDCSGSMGGAPINQLNEGLQLLERELKDDVIAAKRVRLLVIRYGGLDTAEVVGDWCDAMDFTAPTLEANGTTPTGQAVELALGEIEAEKARYKQSGIAYTRPWLFLMSDGVPTDAWESGAQRCCEAERSHKVAVFPIAVGEGSHPDTLGAFCSRGTAGVKRLAGLQFNELFLWLSTSMQVVSQSKTGDQVQLPATDSWSTVTA